MSSHSIIFETRCLSSLTKVFADVELRDLPFIRGSALKNEVYSFQVAYRGNKLMTDIRVRIESELAEAVSVRVVGLVPSELPVHQDNDSYVLRSTPGLYPDPLYPLEQNKVICFPKQWRSVWMTVDLNETALYGAHDINVIFETGSGKQLGAESFLLNIVPVELPKQTLIHTEWFHVDCLATYYNNPIFSEEHWMRIGQFVQTAVGHGINMILTPIFTPPLDTQVGGERPTVQLVDVVKNGDQYRFQFDKLQRWVDLCSSLGVEYFEFSHLFTQWGAGHAPKIVAEENGRTVKIFGWETEASGEPYKKFLSQFLPELIQFIERNKLEKRSLFHVSDEPRASQLQSYKAASEILYQYLAEYPVIDALSDYQFYEQGVVRNPIPGTDHIEPFLNNQVPNLWTYYCSSQAQEVSNRFFSMSQARNRIIGMQLYKFNITGFLHWGYNFWYAQYSVKPIDPFQNTDANFAFPSGDSFLVYPGEHGPIESIRMEVFYEALQDIRALALLESKIGRDAVIALLEEGLAKPITFTEYPKDEQWLLAKREQINQRIKEQ